jgi:hypothetical protein
MIFHSTAQISCRKPLATSENLKVCTIGLTPEAVCCRRSTADSGRHFDYDIRITKQEPPRNNPVRKSRMFRRVVTTLSQCLIAILVGDGGSVDGEDVAGRSGYAKVSRIFARHCLECHGPDGEQREAGLRLDVRTSATGQLDSQHIAIVPGSPDNSELLRRITARDETRMPPVEAGARLSSAEVELITKWIRSGANWGTHWSLTPATERPLPKVRDISWAKRPLDRFILHRIEESVGHGLQHGMAPLESADRRTLIRRVYFDLIGLPPTPQQVRQFQNDKSPDAWKNVVNQLLDTPMYGQRWGRHWLDVVRYGDSNGSDENHAYPLAWRYRNYVIDAFNKDIPFDQFVREQLAGDLLNNESRQMEGVTATGFLAIGTKILAEKDPVKKQADMVDEQIDTIGKSLLGFTVACARCHDHKFDPIPTKDYYALAGILHSTKLEDRALEDPAFAKAKAEFDRRLEALSGRRKVLQAKLTNSPDGVIDRQAENFQRGNVAALDSSYGEGIGIISDPGAQKNFAEWDFQIANGGEYLIQFRYAAKASRPGRLSVNGKVVNEESVARTTGGWMPADQQWFTEGTTTFLKGKNVVRFESEPLMSHIDRVRLVRSNGSNELKTVLDRLSAIDVEQVELQKQAPTPSIAMAVADGDSKNVKVHLRGSHLELGEDVRRGFPMLAAGTSRKQNQESGRFQIDGKQSGRLQLADWMTDSQSGAGKQLARVIVNRVWQWHFGRGLVGTPNNFGLQGELPTHPDLLDWLTLRFIEDGWSLKALHRRILQSATYRQRSVATPNDSYIGFARRRMQVEVIRDTLLFHAGRLDTTPADRLDGVKPQDPSPDDLRKNEDVHRNSNKRSVYLPVIRSNSYRFFLLFDFPNATTSVGKRDITTVPTQALLLMNDPFLMDQAQRFADSVLHAANKKNGKARLRPSRDEPDAQRASGSAEASPSRFSILNDIYLRLFSRTPTDVERSAAAEFLAEYVATSAISESADDEAWSALCQSLMVSSEFIYVE